MKRTLSSDIKWMTYLFLIAGIGLIYHLISSTIDQSFYEDQVIVEPIFIVICAILTYLFNRFKLVEFDPEFLYISSKNEKQEIPLKNVVKIKLTMTKIGNQNLWKIGYLNNEGQSKSVRILPKSSDNSFNDFKTKVKELNKAVKIKNWSHTFDLDQ